MIAKIGKGENMIGALSYNQQKIDKEKGKVLLTNKIPETLDGSYTTAYLNRYFEPYLLANNKTEKPVRHISLNPDPSDKVSDEQFRDIAQQYMLEMGYGNQPFVVFKHTDIERTHIHIVTTCVEINGKKIPDSYDHPRSMAICRKLEEKYNLKPATEQKQSENNRVFKPVDYFKGNVKSQVASVIRYLPKYYKYQSLGAYNALLSLFNITAEEVKGELHGQPKKGLVYFALNEAGEKVSNPFKSSLFGKEAGHAQLQIHFEQSTEKMASSSTRAILKNTIEAAMHIASDEIEFKKQLVDQGINTVVRRNDTGRIYGMTFVDHESRSVWNGSQLGKNLSANVFNDWWSQQAGVKREEESRGNRSPDTVQSIAKNSLGNDNEQPHALFDFLHKEHPTYMGDNLGLIDGLGGLLPLSQGEEDEEQVFENQMKKKKKRKKGQ